MPKHYALALQKLKKMQLIQQLAQTSVLALAISFGALTSQSALAETRITPKSATQNNSNAPNFTSTNPSIVYRYLVAEVAGQRGEYLAAAQILYDLARETRDARLAERASVVATFARQGVLAMNASSLWAELDPNSQEAAQASSQLYIASGNLKAALPQLRKLLVKEETRANGFLYLNTLLANHQDKTEVLNAVRNLAKDYPKLPEAQIALGHAALVANQPAEAKKAFATADALRPGWEIAAQMQGQMLLRENPKAALDFYSDFLKKNPNTNQVRLAYAKLLVNQQQYPAAKAEFTRITETDKTNAEASYAVGVLALEGKDYAAAEQYFQQALARAHKDAGLIHLNLGMTAERQKQDGKAIAWYDKITEGDHFFTGRLYAAHAISRLKSADAAIEMLDSVEDLTLEQQIMVIQTEAEILAQAKRPQEGFDLLQKAIANMQNTPELVYDFALAAERIGKLDLMEKELNRAIKMKPDYAAAYNALGYSLADRNVRLKEAKNLIETALKIAPNSHYIIDSLGWVQYRMGNLNEAVKQLRQAYNLQADPEIAAHLGEVLWKLGQKTEAKQVLENALKAFPDNDTLKNTQQKFKS